MTSEATRPPVDVWRLQLSDAVALTQSATLPLYVRAIQRRRNRVEVTYPDGSTGWVPARKLLAWERI